MGSVAAVVAEIGIAISDGIVPGRNFFMKFLGFVEFSSANRFLLLAGFNTGLYVLVGEDLFLRFTASDQGERGGAQESRP